MRILVFDNYDSFTYNLVHRIEKILHSRVDVFRNDQVPLEKINEYNKIILSPGPGLPEQAGLLIRLIQQFAATKSILGVCLGHQAVAMAFGAKLINLPRVYHGVSTPCNISTDNFLFKNLPPVIQAGRYHSWVIDESTLSPDFEITARDENGFIMGIQHHSYDVCGVQFHPESILTPDGEVILYNWLIK